MLYRNFIALVASLLLTCNAQSTSGQTAVAGKKPCIPRPVASGLGVAPVTELIKPTTPAPLVPTPAPVAPTPAPVVPAPAPAVEVVVPQPVAPATQKPGCRARSTVAPLPAPETQVPATPLPPKEVSALEGYIQKIDGLFSIPEAELINYINLVQAYVNVGSGKLPYFFQDAFNHIITSTPGGIDTLKKLVNHVEVNHYQKLMFIVTNLAVSFNKSIPEADYNAIEDAVFHLNCQTGLLSNSAYHNIMIILYSHHQY